MIIFFYAPHLDPLPKLRESWDECAFISRKLSWAEVNIDTNDSMLIVL